MKALGTLMLVCASLPAQSGLNPAKLGAPPTDSWPTYNGDYSGRRYSALSKINQSNINSLSLAWLYRATPAPGGGGGSRISSTPVLVNGILYFTMPDNAWAVDARTGREVWHYQWTSHGGDHIGNRGAGMYGNWLYFETPDCNLVSLNLNDGKERWHKSICDLDQILFRLDGAAGGQEPCHHRRERRRSRRPGYHRVPRSRDRRIAVALVYRSAEDGRSGIGNLAERGSHAARRRHDLADPPHTIPS